MSSEEFKKLGRKSWEDDYNYLCIDGSKKRDQGRYCICNESKKRVKKQHLRRRLFDYINVILKDRENLEKLEELVSLQSQVKLVRLQDKLCEQKFHENITKNFRTSY